MAIRLLCPPLLLASAAAALGVQATFDSGVGACPATVQLNGAPVQGPELALRTGLNVLALEVGPAVEPTAVHPVLTLDDRRLGPESGWQQAATSPADGWQAAITTAGWTTVHAVTLAAGQRAWLRKGLWLPEPSPGFFPHLDTVYLPRGASNLVRPYLHLPPGVSAAGARLVVELPRGIGYRSCEPTVGQAVAGHTALAAGDRIRHVLDLGEVRGQGFELSLRWGDATDHTLSYQPAIQDGGTFGWKHLSATVDVPAGAVSVKPLIIKWQNRGISGTFWVDNLVVHEERSERNLLDCGTFDEPGWGETFRGTAGEGVDGSRCVKIVATPEQVDRQQARWVGLPDAPPPAVEAGQRYVVELDLRCQEVQTEGWHPNVAALFSVDDDVPLGEAPLAAWLELLDGAVVEVPQPARLVVLPELKDIRPVRSRIAPCYYGDVFSDHDVQAAYADNAWRAGITWTYGRTSNAVAQALQPRGLKVILSLPWDPWSPVGDLVERLKAEPDLQAVDFKGARLGQRVCPTWALANFDALRPGLEQLIDGLLRGQDYAGADWDLEQPVVDPPTFCTCPRCLAAFAQRFGLDAAGLTPDTLLGDQRERWVEFRCEQNADVMGRLRELLKAAQPDLEVSVYSGYQGVRNREHYGADWAALGPHLDLAIAGYGGARDANDATVEALHGVPFMGGEMWYLSPQSDERAAPNPLTWRNRLLRQYLGSGCLGVLIWYLPTMDGGAFYYTSEAAAVIAAEEGFLATATRAEADYAVTGLPADDWFAFRGPEGPRVYLLNLKAEPVEVTVTPQRPEANLPGQVDGRVEKVLGAYACEIVK